MDLAEPWTAVASPLVGSVLTVLTRTTQPLSGREVHRLAGAGSQEGVRKVLQRLTSLGLVMIIEKPGTNLFMLNRAHLATPAVDVLTTMRGRLMERIAQSVAGWTIRPAHLSVFGSMARGDGGPGSDIDLLLVRPDEVDPLNPEWDAQVGNLREAIQTWTGNYASFMEQSQAELRTLLATDAAWLRDWKQDAIHISGLSILDLTSEGQ